MWKIYAVPLKSTLIGACCIILRYFFAYGRIIRQHAQACMQRGMKREQRNSSSVAPSSSRAHSLSAPASARTHGRERESARAGPGIPLARKSSTPFGAGSFEPPFCWVFRRTPASLPRPSVFHEVV